MATSSGFMVQRQKPIESFSIDERGFVKLAKVTYKHLETLYPNSDKYCSELGFVIYSLYILRVQQISGYGLSQVKGAGYIEAQEFVSLLKGESTLKYMINTLNA